MEFVFFRLLLAALTRIASLYIYSPQIITCLDALTQTSSLTTEKCRKAVPVIDRIAPQCDETSRFPHLLDNHLTDGGEVVSLTRRPAGRSLHPTRFLVLLQGPQCGWKH
jgi:hypothetical protein